MLSGEAGWALVAVKRQRQTLGSPALTPAALLLRPAAVPPFRPQRRRARQAEHVREVERLLAYRRQLYTAMQVGGGPWVGDKGWCQQAVRCPASAG